MDGRLSGTDHSWFQYFQNAIESVLSCRSQNVVRTARDVLYVMLSRYVRPDLTPPPPPPSGPLTWCWATAKNVLGRASAAPAAAVLRLLSTAAYGGRRSDRTPAVAGTGTDAADGRTSDAPEGTGVKCEVLYDPGPGSAVVDVVFIHGLRGDKLKTWVRGAWNEAGQRPEPVVVRSAAAAADDDDDGLGPRASAAAGDTTAAGDSRLTADCWPRDWLPLDCPYARIITVGYNTDPYLWRPIWLGKPAGTTMKDRGLEMISLLRDFRVGHNPITWVGHSKGGLFIKQILVHANENRQTRPIIANTRRILFYSVPHNGSPLASIKLPLFQRSIELLELVNDTQDIQKLQKTFQDMMNNNRQIQVKSFIETKLTLMKLIYLRIVSIQSADPGFGDLYGVPLDHRNICKPKNRNCFLYQELVNMIHSLKQSTIEGTA